MFDRNVKQIKIWKRVPTVKTDENPISVRKKQTVLKIKETIRKNIRRESCAEVPEISRFILVLKSDDENSELVIVSKSYIVSGNSCFVSRTSEPWDVLESIVNERSMKSTI